MLSPSAFRPCASARKRFPTSSIILSPVSLASSSPTAPTGSTPFPPEGMTLEQFEDEIIREALRRASGNKSQAARLLGLSRNALRYRLAKLGVPDEEEK